MKRFFLPAILLLALFLRVLWLDKYPIGFTQDEASFGFDAYSLLKTGKDQWGSSWPLALRSFGDFKPPLYAYLTIPSVAIFGLNEFAVRLPNALLGSFSVFLTYFLVKELFKDKKLALFSAFILSISPWHVSLSRGAFEANLTTFLMPLGVYAFLVGAKERKWLAVSAFSFGLNLFSYHSARFLTPLIILFLFWWRRTKFDKKFIVSFSPFLIFLGLVLFQLVTTGSTRVADVGIFNPTDKWQSVSDRRYEAVLAGLPDSISRVFSNKVVYVWKQFIVNYLSYLSPQFLFTQGAGEGSYGMIPGRGALYLIELPFLIVSLWFLSKKKLTRENPAGLIIFWILVSHIPAALSKGPGYTGNRAAFMMPAIQILSAYGGLILFNLLGKFSSAKKLIFLYSLAFFISFVFFFEDYVYHSPRQNAAAMLYGRRQMMEFLALNEERYGEIIVSRSFSEPQIHVAFYNKWEPAEVQKESADWLRYEKQSLLFLDQLGSYRLGKYTFGDINYQKRKGIPGILLAGKPEEFPAEVIPLQIIYYPNQKPAIYIVDPNNQNLAKL